MRLYIYKKIVQFLYMSNKLLINLSSSHGDKLDSIIRNISLSCKIIKNKIRRSSLENICTSTSITNFHGEEVKTLDVISNRCIINSLSCIGSIKYLVSEEDVYKLHINDDGEYIVCFDPLDGSSNIDVNINIGTIFGIYKSSDRDIPYGSDILVSGYCLYGPSTIFVLCIDNKVNIYTLDDDIGEFVLTDENIQIPYGKKIYSINEGNYHLWDENIKSIVDKYKKDRYSLRYVGSMVADIHRTLLYGGIFMYPSSTNAPNGKLRYLYEVAPMSHIITVAGGKSLVNSINALNYEPDTIHDRVPIIIGSFKDI